MIKRYSRLRPAWRFAILMLATIFASLFFTDSAPVFNVAILCIVGSIAGYHLLTCPEEFNDAERLGVGLFVAGMIMSTPAVWLDHTPFDDWSLNVGRAGASLFFYAVVRRRIHDKEVREGFRGYFKNDRVG
jgi:hypothetical protein